MAASRFIAPVGMKSDLAPEASCPIRMIEPFPICFSIWAMARFRAFFLSSAWRSRALSSVFSSHGTLRNDVNCAECSCTLYAVGSGANVECRLAITFTAHECTSAHSDARIYTETTSPPAWPERIFDMLHRRQHHRLAAASPRSHQTEGSVSSASRPCPSVALSSHALRHPLHLPALSPRDRLCGTPMLQPPGVSSPRQTHRHCRAERSGPPRTGPIRNRCSRIS